MPFTSASLSPVSSGAGSRTSGVPLGENAGGHLRPECVSTIAEKRGIPARSAETRPNPLEDARHSVHTSTGPSLATLRFGIVSCLAQWHGRGSWRMHHSSQDWRYSSTTGPRGARPARVAVNALQSHVVRYLASEYMESSTEVWRRRRVGTNKEPPEREPGC